MDNLNVNAKQIQKNEDDEELEESLPNESKSIVIYIPEELDDYPEYKDYIKKVSHKRELTAYNKVRRKYIIKHKSNN